MLWQVGEQYQFNKLFIHCLVFYFLWEIEIYIMGEKPFVVSFSGCRAKLV